MFAYPVVDLLTLSQAPNIGPSRLRTLVAAFPDLESLRRAPARSFITLEGFHKKTSTELAAFFRGDAFDASRRFADDQLSRINKVGGRIITYWDRQYPDILKKIYDPPALLYCVGELEPADAFSIAVVGTRLPSSYGIVAAERLSHEIVQNGMTVISGLARGVDTVAHDAALRSGGRTIAVIGSGLDKLYPAENRALAGRIAEHGCLLSEFPMGTKPDAPNFPRRNRIVSGMSLGTLIIETDINGGAMITGSLALDQNREVFAIPGQINSRKSRGCNLLIKSGRATLVESFEDIAAELGSKLHPILGRTEVTEPPPQLTLFEQAIYDRLADAPVQIDSLAEQAGLSTPDALVALLNLEFKNLVKQLPGKMFIRG